uniref:Putative secreted protein n=1 Tax=Ixodes ricinus TaxID=34613 RepID=V5H9N9_IXORI
MAHSSARAMLLLASFLLLCAWASHAQLLPGEPACRGWYQECGIQRHPRCCGRLQCWHGRCIFRKDGPPGLPLTTSTRSFPPTKLLHALHGPSYPV